MRIRVKAPAKLNLSLGVGALRGDGYHNLVTVFTALDLCDEVAAEPASGIELILRGASARDLPADGSNVAWQAAEALARSAGLVANVRLVISKEIPVAAGLAGGSADAAATLVACDELWGLHTEASALALLAAELGSDVPFCLQGRVAVGTGRGEHLRSVRAPRPFHWVLLPASTGLSTPKVYAELDRLRSVAGVTRADIDIARASQAVLVAVASGDPEALAPTLYNDLQPAAMSLHPALQEILLAGQVVGALAGIVCGSGPTCAFLARDSEHAVVLARELARNPTMAGRTSPIVVTSGGGGAAVVT